MSEIKPFRKHIFFTGNLQVGKSTIVRKIIAAHPEITLGGYFTCWTNKSNMENASLYIFPAERNLYLSSGEYVEVNRNGGYTGLSEELANENSLVAHFGKTRTEKIFYPEVFDNLGVELLEKAKKSDIILMDEVGFIEDKSEKFKEKVLEILDGDTQVVGIVRHLEGREGELINAVKSHPNVEVVWVTEDNRDSLPERFI